MARRPKRPSVKDKGVDILFPAGSETEGIGERQLVEAPTDEPEGEAGAQHASMQASTQTNMRASDEASDVDLLVFEDAMGRIAEAGRITGSFRFTAPELEALDDLVYRSRKRHRVRLVKQEVVRLGLAALLAEYKERGDESVLGRYLRQLKER